MVGRKDFFFRRKGKEGNLALECKQWILLRKQCLKEKYLLHFCTSPFGNNDFFQISSGLLYQGRVAVPRSET